MAYTIIDDPSLYFQTTIYTGNGGSQDITNSGNSDLQPDWLWIKQRSGAQNVSSHVVKDSSRGVTKEIFPNATSAEGTSSLIDGFLSDGFSINNTANDHYNFNNALYVAWQWKANGGTETNSQAESGSNIACSVQANTTAGFSIITYTGTGGTGHTFLHGLGSAPAWFIIKRRNDTEDWLVYHHKNTSQPETDHLLLNTTDGTSDSDTRFDDTAPNGTEIALGNNAVCNADASTYVCYAFKEVKGYSKFGSYLGAVEAGRPFIYTGFKPAWLMIKRTDATTNARWYILDNARNPNNPVNKELYANQTDADADRIAVDFLSNGFKLRTSATGYASDGGTYIYMAFAESPFVSSEGVPTTAG